MSKPSRIALIVVPVVLVLAVLGYAVISAVQVRRLAETAASPRPEASSGTTQPLNPSAPVIVAQTLEPTASRVKRGTIIFDMAHSEVFGPQDQSELGQSKAVERMRAAGYAVRVTTDKVAKATLGDDVVAVYLPGPMVPLTDAERTVLDDFVRRGGTIIMTVHVPFPILGTLARYGLPVGTGVMVDPSAQSDPGIWATSVMKSDPITDGVKSLTVVSGWPVGVSPSEIADPRIVVQAPKGVVVDSNGDNAFDSADPQPPYGVVGVASIGSGRVVVLGDDAILANIAIDTSDNARFLDNLLELISAPKPA